MEPQIDEILAEIKAHALEVIRKAKGQVKSEELTSLIRCCAEITEGQRKK